MKQYFGTGGAAIAGIARGTSEGIFDVASGRV